MRLWKNRIWARLNIISSAYTVDYASFAEMLFVCSAVFYAVVQLGLLIGVRRLRNGTNNEQLFISVIVAARNEEQSIGALLKALTHQTYPTYEVIIVDDRSTDSTAEIVRSYQAGDARIKLISVVDPSPTMPAKKHALTLGIRTSTAEILCFTDADCIPGSHWVESLVASFDRNVGLVAGYSPYDPALLRSTTGSGRPWGMLSRFIVSEEFKGAMWTAGSIGLRCAWLCTGRNLAYRRSVFEEVGGFEKIKMSISGDDDLFIQLVRRQTRWNIRYITDERNHVRTAPPADFRAFVEQRTRHFSSGKYFTLPMKAFFFFFHLANLVLLIGLLLAFGSSSFRWYALIAFAAKIASDVCLAGTMARKLFGDHYRKHFSVFGVLFTELVYILYNTFIGPLGFVKSIRWKPGQTNADPLTTRP